MMMMMMMIKVGYFEERKEEKRKGVFCLLVLSTVFVGLLFGFLFDRNDW